MKYLIFALALYGALVATLALWASARLPYLMPPGVNEPVEPRKPIRILT